MIYTKEIKEISRIYDLIVCGGGMSGFATALAAAEEGAKVLLIERGACLGGVATQGLVNHILGARTFGHGRTITSIGGIYARLERRLLDMGAAVDVNDVDFSNPPHGWVASLAAGLIIDGEKTKLVLEQFLTEAGAEILYQTTVVDAIKRNDTEIEGVILSGKDGLSFVRAKYFADTTGDADICAFAECPYMIGDESGGVAPSSLELHVEHVNEKELSEYMNRTKDIRFRALIEPLRAKGIWDFPYEIFISVMLTEKDVFMINTNRMVGVDGLNAASVTKGILDARQENYKIFDIMKQYFPGFQNARIRNIAPVMGIRESRRIVGEYTLSVEDLINKKKFEDAIAYSVYGWDLPDPKKPSHQPDIGKKKPLYTPIPYRCLIPKAIDNLIVAGRSISVERPVLGPIRVMGPCIAMGEAVGYATTLALMHSLSFKDVNVHTLQEKIIQKGGMLTFDI